ncbi:ATPase AAA-2 domain protein [Gluconacetobacter diazotrophicus PA1 5]|uniref:ATP-dependent Clp protease ATP-binding subunit n=2 Tax=Gluconacetobacter diazotrophicus TaxID=33996 RepID=A0A7W4FD76_GLUDI|nr:AAA family ATPase [Gluconacetobacter diazotrophicus]ACI51825.1 ATPase AAA-2 domain protein [Gluconacetobacter diazotrophicus PA1 5]MBB2155620.1 ATP-dependent Clp protease ATP-binding subunit [Gluconacetobacter diazotrophicus]TWB11169.1 Cdc48 subfamily AAA family protein [Gluconacetobacter diazotrophicus]CAP55303.1 putative chaperone clpB [Gluconacetobacter diazotrophicus PA1 5]
MKALLPALNRLMPVMMVIFLILASLQAAASLHLSLASLTHFMEWCAPAFPVLTAGSSLLVLAGLMFETRAERLARKGLRRRRGWMMDVLARLTNRTALEEMMAREQKETVIDAEELAASLRARVIGQDQVCEDIAAQLRRRMALQVRGKPVGIFLLAGPPGTGKTYLAKQMARQLDRPLLHFDMTQMSSPHAATQLFGSPKGYVGSDTFGKLTGGLKEKPDAVVLLDEIEKAHPDVFKKFLTAWNDGHVTEASTGQQVSTVRAIFVLTSNIATDALSEIADRLADEPDRMRAESVEALRQAGFAPEVLNRLDRIFVFRALTGLDVARVAALEIEAMIESYGLRVETGGIDASLLFEVMRRQDRMGASASARDLVRSIEDMMSDSLISARQQGAKLVRVVSGENGVTAEIANDADAQRARVLR